MKKLIIFILCFVCLCACSKSSEKIIMSAFDNYVQKTFDDPSKVSEIVSVSIEDTISTKELQDMLMDLKNMSDSLQIQKKETTDKLQNLVDKYGSKCKTIDGFLDLWSEYEDVLQENKEFYWGMASDLLSGARQLVSPDSVSQWKSFEMINFTLKYRINKGDSLKLETIKGCTDPSLSEFYFQNDNQNNPLYKQFSSALETISFFEEWIENDSKVTSKANELIELIEASL